MAQAYKNPSLKCPVVMHWSCLPRTEQEEILKAARERDRAEWLKAHEGEEADVEREGPRKRPGLNFSEMTEFICSKPFLYLDIFFAMGRGRQTADVDVPACEMKKW